MAEAELLHYSGASGTVLQVAAALLGKVDLMPSGIYDKERRELERQVGVMRYVLADAELDLKAEKDPSVRRLIKAFKDAAYRARDVLDQIIKLPAAAAAAEHHSSTAPRKKRRLKFRRKLKDVVRTFRALRDMATMLSQEEPQSSQMVVDVRDDDEVDPLLDHQDHQNGQVLDDGRDDDEVLEPFLLSRPRHAEFGSDYSVPAATEVDVDVTANLPPPTTSTLPSALEQWLLGRRSRNNSAEIDLEAGRGPRDSSQPTDDIYSVANPKSPTDTVPVEDPADEVEQQKRCSKYSMRALGFAITMFAAYWRSASSSSGNVSKVAMAAYFIVVTANLVSAVKKMPKWGGAVVYVSSLLLVLVSYLLLVTFDKGYAYAIIFPVSLPIVVVLGLGQQTSSSKDEAADDQALEKIFDLSAGIVNGGGLITMILGYYMAQKQQHTDTAAVTALGFLFFFTVVLGLYLMAVTTVRTAALTRHARRLACLQIALLLATLSLIAARTYPVLPARHTLPCASTL